jgi:hypothetical protein
MRRPVEAELAGSTSRALATSKITSSVTGETTSILPSDESSTQRPPM